MARMVWYDTAQLAKLQKAVEDEDWFASIVLSAVQLERHGYLEMMEHFEKLGLRSQIVKNLIDHQNLRAIGGFLLLLGIIDTEELATILVINNERNKFVHRKKKERFKRGREAQEQYGSLAKEAMRILTEKLNAKRLLVGR